MAADVKEMYHMLRLPENDKPAMRFLWRDSPEEEPSVYQFKRTVFGEVSAPSRVNYTMRRNADENGDDLPLGVKAATSTFTWMMAYHQQILARKLLKCGSR